MYTTLKRIAVSLGCSLFVIGLMTPMLVHAQPGNCTFNDPDDPLGVNCASATNLSNRDPRIVAAEIIQVALGLIGIITVVLIIWAGFRWLTSAGREDEISAAKKTLAAAVIGLIIILMAYSLTTFIISELYEATQARSYGI